MTGTSSSYVTLLKYTDVRMLVFKLMFSLNVLYFTSLILKATTVCFGTYYQMHILKEI